MRWGAINYLLLLLLLLLLLWLSVETMAKLQPWYNPSWLTGLKAQTNRQTVSTTVGLSEGNRGTFLNCETWGNISKLWNTLRCYVGWTLTDSAHAHFLYYWHRFSSLFFCFFFECSEWSDGEVDIVSVTPTLSYRRQLELDVWTAVEVHVDKQELIAKQLNKKVHTNNPPPSTPPLPFLHPTPPLPWKTSTNILPLIVLQTVFWLYC